MNQQGITKKIPIPKDSIRVDNLNEVLNDFAELSKISQKLKVKYTNLEEELRDHLNIISILENDKATFESQLKVTQKKLNDTKLNNNRLLEENSKIPILNEKITNLECQLKDISKNLQENTTKYTNQLKAANAEKAALNDKLKQISTELNSKNLACAKLSEENSKISNLNAEISKLKKQFHQTSLENELLKEKYEKLTAENATLVLLKQTSLELENEISKCTQLSLENVELKNNYEKLTAENSTLRVKQDDIYKTTLMLNQNVNTLEQKLKHVTLQLEKEIATGIQLNAENQKLKSLSPTTRSESGQIEENIQIQQLEEKLKQLSAELEKEVSKNSALGEYNKQLDRLISGFKSKAKSETVSTKSVENLKKSQDQLNVNSNFKVLIRDVPTDQILNPLEKTIIDLASKMSICINRNDITQVRFMERKGLSEYSNKVSLLVDFKTSEIKTNFISNRSKLKLNTSTKHIQIKDFVENEVYSLFLYANEHLRPIGFHRIWCKDNQVFVKKNDSDTEIEITSRNQVDVLTKPNWRLKILNITITIIDWIIKCSKMLTLNISCTVCKETFKNSDAIYSTSCGHIFHFICMNQWRSKSTSCPQCRSYNPTTHSVYFNFEDTREYEKIVNDLKDKLQKTDDKMKKIKEDVAKKEQKIDDLQRLYNISEQWRAELETKIYKLSHESQVKNVQHTKELNLKLNEIQYLETHLETMQKAEGVHELCEKIQKLEEDNTKLKDNNKVDEDSKIILNHKIEILEQRLKHVTLELQKQIAENVNRSMDKMIAQPNEAKTNKSNQQQKNNRKRRDSRKILCEQQQKNVDQSIIHNEEPIKELSNKQHSNHRTKQNINRQFELTQPNDTKVVIKDIPSEDIVYPLRNTVISLASKMSINLSSDDMTNVSILEQKSLNTINSNKIALLVQFKTINGKIQFLMNKNRLKFNSSTKFIQLKEYIDEDVYPIFMYANRVLRENGFEYIECKHNQVFAKKNRHDTAGIVIMDKNHVDRIVCRQILENRL
ncbi:putative leucine-rich repeat-containing protein DDB_G0290503 [Lucilia sericata]|uniref:putative leucine-rich repeat-containing protein DDB_G0290503 n=1 Tax=Lucilia sericata TaxID=13632 RepID=UPI0018A87EFE|nr:putative leucine-rich repeat-containing protein DDB_G0290503 [Lucilia sericata]